MTDPPSMLLKTAKNDLQIRGPHDYRGGAACATFFLEVPHPVASPPPPVA